MWPGEGGSTLRWICRDRVFTLAREGEGGLERGATLVLFAIILPLVLVFGAVVVDIGNWWVHARHLQTKVDAAAFAGGGAWGFPCGPDVDASIEAQARQYVGPHMTAAGVVLTSGFNPQVGGTEADRIHVVLNGGDWWDDDAGAAPADRTDPLNPSICEAKVLDVKATEANADLLFGWLPFSPDIKRKARVEIQEVEGLTGLLPIAVRLPQPLSVAAIFYDEAPAAKGQILRQVLPRGLHAERPDMHLRRSTRTRPVDHPRRPGPELLGELHAGRDDRSRRRHELPAGLRHPGSTAAVLRHRHRHVPDREPALQPGHEHADRPVL